ncbi:MAG: DUF1844 domain-containing protein [Planctomycetota bacterium]
MSDPTPKPPSDASAPSLHIDSDWKAQAEAERAKLAEREAAMQARAKDVPEGLPPADFRGLVGLLASQAVMGLGTMADQQGRVVVDLEGSKFAIDILHVLAEKTKGNLTPEESGELDEVLRELRLRFSAITRMLAEQMSKAPGSVVSASPAAAGASPAAPQAKPASAASKLIIP